MLSWWLVNVKRWRYQDTPQVPLVTAKRRWSWASLLEVNEVSDMKHRWYLAWLAEENVFWETAQLVRQTWTNNWTQHEIDLRYHIKHVKCINEQMFAFETCVCVPHCYRLQDLSLMVLWSKCSKRFVTTEACSHLTNARLERETVNCGQHNKCNIEHKYIRHNSILLIIPIYSTHTNYMYPSLSLNYQDFPNKPPNRWSSSHWAARTVRWSQRTCNWWWSNSEGHILPDTGEVWNTDQKM